MLKTIGTVLWIAFILVAVAATNLFPIWIGIITFRALFG